MQLPTRILLLASGLGALSATRGQTTEAEPNAPVTLEPVRVTADLWGSPLDRIPASVTVYDEPLLQAGAVQHFGQLVDRIPNLTWTGGTSRPRYLQIRGIGENSQYEGETPDSAVRFLVDDFDVTGLGTLADTFDVQQVEVLRGPQAGAFGANAAGGVVRLVTNAPTPFWTGRIEGSLGGDDLRSGGFALGGPLLEREPQRLMMRVAVHQHQSDGFRRNLTVNRDTNARDEFMARLRLVWNPNDLWAWESALLFSDVDNGFDEFALDNNGRYTYSDQPGRDEQRTLAGSLRGTYQGWADTRLTSVTSLAAIDSVYSYDDDWTAASYHGFSHLERERTILNQELRLDSEPGTRAAGWIDRWTAGVFASRIEEDGVYTNEDPWTLRGLRTTYETTNIALFSQVAHDFSPDTRLIVGLRAEHLDLEGSGISARLEKDTGTSRPPATVRPQFDDTLLGGKVTLEHDLSPSQLLFASLARGYKGGGINVDARIDPAVDPLTYDTEFLWNYEVGLRGHWLQERLRGEVTAFYLDRHDAQVRDSAGFGGSYRFFTDNGRGAEVYGLEAAADYALGGDWALSGSLAWMESHLDRFTLANGNSGGGRRLANTPRWGHSLGLRYQPADGWRGSIVWVGRAAHFDSNNHEERRSGFDVVDATLGYAWGPWTATLWARNVFDERYETRVFYFGNEEPDYAPARYEARAAPRQVGVTVSYAF